MLQRSKGGAPIVSQMSIFSVEAPDPFQERILINQIRLAQSLAGRGLKRAVVAHFYKRSPRRRGDYDPVLFDKPLDLRKAELGPRR